jgi:hypothetical protein
MDLGHNKKNPIMIYQLNEFIIESRIFKVVKMI